MGEANRLDLTHNWPLHVNGSICSAESRLLAVSIIHAANNLKFYVSILTFLETIKWWALFHQDHKRQISCYVSYIVISADLFPWSLCFLCKSQLKWVSTRLCSDISKSSVEIFYSSISQWQKMTDLKYFGEVFYLDFNFNIDIIPSYFQW